MWNAYSLTLEFDKLKDSINLHSGIQILILLRAPELTNKCNLKIFKIRTAGIRYSVLGERQVK